MNYFNIHNQPRTTASSTQLPKDSQSRNSSLSSSLVSYLVRAVNVKGNRARTAYREVEKVRREPIEIHALNKFSSFNDSFTISR